MTINSFTPSIADYAVSGTTCSPMPYSLAAGSSCTVSVTFTPSKTGTDNGNLSVSDNGGTKTQKIGLYGSGS